MHVATAGKRSTKHCGEETNREHAHNRCFGRRRCSQVASFVGAPLVATTSGERSGAVRNAMSHAIAPGTKPTPSEMQMCTGFASRWPVFVS